MVASDVYLRDDQNEAAHTAARAAVLGAYMGDVTASGEWQIARIFLFQSAYLLFMRH
jgi:hypothetical protein